MVGNDFFELYMRYTERSESPRIYHRWCAISAASSQISRNIWFANRDSNTVAPIYSMLIGDPGTRKSTAIKLSKKLLAESGYGDFAPAKSSKEKFLLDLAGISDDGKVSELGTDTLIDNIWGSQENAGLREVFIMADEFTVFAGNSNVEFYDLLGELWGWDDPRIPYSHRYKNSQISIMQPTVSMLCGTTQENFARAFPPETLGTGFLSRMILIYGERTEEKIAFPEAPDAEHTEKLIKSFQRMRSPNAVGPVGMTSEARKLLEELYVRWEEIDDSRFISYGTRRFEHLKKLLLVLVGTDGRLEITKGDAIFANTILSAAELLMPRALGEFGKSRNSDVAHKIMEFLGKASRPMQLKDIWKVVARDLDRTDNLNGILTGLMQKDVVQIIPGSGYLVKKKIYKDPIHVDWSLLTKEERSNV